MPGPPPRTSTPADRAAAGREHDRRAGQPARLGAGGVPDAHARDVGEGVGRSGPHALSPIGGVDDAEPVAVRVREDDEVVRLVGIGPVLDPAGSRAPASRSTSLRLVGGVEVEVDVREGLRSAWLCRG